MGGSADFSHSLCEQMAAAAQESPMEDINAQQLMAAGYERVLAADSVSIGGSTVCVGVARPNGQLDVAKYVSLPPFPCPSFRFCECICLCGIQANLSHLTPNF